MRAMKTLKFLLCLLVIFNSCSCEEDKPEPLRGRTVLVYLAADNNLSSFSENDIDEMMKGVPELESTLDNLIVYVDNANGKPRLFHLKKSSTGIAVQENIWTYELQNSVNVEVMKDVFSRAFTAFPAASHGLVLWSHSDGWLPSSSSSSISRSFGQDGSSKMNISQLHEVLKDYYFDFILFDACFMQSVEVLYELRDCCDYFVGSPTEIPGPGAPYQTVVKSMFTIDRNKNTAAFNVAEAYYDYYAANYNAGKNISNDNWTGGVAVSVVKTTELEQLATVVRNIFSQYLNGQTSIDVSDIMCYNPYQSNSYYYDLDGFIRSLTKSDTNYTAWQGVYRKAVPYYETTEKNYSAFGGMFSMEGSEGLSAYIPTKNLTSHTFYHSFAWYTAAGWDKTELF
jgi:hypothetical protein